MFRTRGGYAHGGAGTNTQPVETLQQSPVALENTLYPKRLRDLTLVEWLQSAAAAVLRRIHAHAIAVRASIVISQPFAKLDFKIPGNRVFQLLGLIMNLVPFHIENLGQHTLDQVVPVEQTIGNRAS